MSKVDLVWDVLLHETRFPVVQSVAIAAEITTDKRKIRAAMSERPRRKVSFDGFRKGFYAVPAEAQSAVGGKVIYAGWYRGKPYAKVDGVKVPSGTDRFRVVVNAVSGGVATPTEAPASVPAEDTLLAL